jgi:ABC-2 type transport system ATP-binding protein
MIAFEDVVLGTAGFSLRVPSARVEAGRVTALVGRNGSGKTSLIETLLGLRAQRQGQIRIDGEPAMRWWSDLAHKRTVGVQLQAMAYPTRTRVDEVVRLHGLVYGCGADPAVAGLLGLPDLHRQFYGQLSRGEKQRVDLYVAWAHDPALLLLDEPCTGLDARYHARALQWLGAFCQRPGKTVLMATHDARELALAQDLLRIETGVLHQATVAISLAALGDYCGELAAPASTHAQVLARAQALPGHTAARCLDGARVQVFGSGPPFKQAFEHLALELQAPHVLRLVDHADLLHGAAQEPA